MENRRLVQEWLTEYKSLSSGAIPQYASKLIKNEQVVEALLTVLEDQSCELFDPVCSQLYEFYRSGEQDLRRFCLQFVPTLIWLYLWAYSTNKNSGRIETLLLGIYNLEVVDSSGDAQVSSYTIPTLSKPSIYHEPMNQMALTESLLSYQRSDHRTVTQGPFPQIEAIDSQKRLDVLRFVLSEYNSSIGLMYSSSHKASCLMCSRLCSTGFAERPSSMMNGNLELHLEKLPNRIQLSSQFMVEMLTAVYFCMFNGFSDLGKTALEDAYVRATYELYSDVMLMANAIKNSLASNPSGQPGDGPIGINVTVNPVSPKVRRTAITNASFKASRKKETTVTVTVESVRISQSIMDELEGSSHSDAEQPKQVDSKVEVQIIDQSGNQTVDYIQLPNQIKSNLSSKLNNSEKNDSKGSVDKSTSSLNSDGSDGKPRLSPASHSRELPLKDSRNLQDHETAL
ncbi:hyccin-like isoform X2 [Anneissia japonica]|uniref:hyccin-like isoform X2 n=1 Tax=Anneissia japonica TaxID=1529436 RepID=UPI0014259D34|nr:hyccin-like isoform X2 [Anneissia japonica]